MRVPVVQKSRDGTARAVITTAHTAMLRRKRKCSTTPAAERKARRGVCVYRHASVVVQR